MWNGSRLPKGWPTIEWNKVEAAFFGIVGSILVAVPALLLLSTIRVANPIPDSRTPLTEIALVNSLSSPPVPTVGDASPRSPATATPATDAGGLPIAPEAVTRVEASPVASAFMVVQHLSPAGAQLHVTGSLQIPTELKAGIHDDLSEQSVTKENDEPPPNLLLRQQFEVAELRLRVRDPSGIQVNEARIPLRSLFPDQGESDAAGKAQFSLDLPLASSTIKYPDDQYAFDGSFELQLPSPLYLRDRGPFLLPLEVLVRSSSGMAGTQVSVMQASDANTGVVPVKLLVRRESLTRWYVRAMTLVPAFLFILLAHLAYRGTERLPELRNTLIGTAVAIIGLLSLRSILVPPDIPGLVRADFVLATGIAAIVALAFLKYATELWAAR